MIIINKFENVLAASGLEMGVSDWFDVTQLKVDAFAELTGDKQYIHVDREMALAAGLKGTIAHGFFTLSLLPFLSKTLNGARIELPSCVVLNYGMDKFRLLAPVSIPSRIRLHTQIGKVSGSIADGIRVVFQHRVEIEGSDRPALYAEAIDLIQVPK